MAELRSEVMAQLKELNVPQKHLELIKHLIVLTREEAKKKVNGMYVAATGVTNPDQGAICLIPDFRWNLAHEIGHLVWSVLPQDTKDSYHKLHDKEREEWDRLIGKAMRKFLPDFLKDFNLHSERLEEDFCWSYSFYLCMEDFSTKYPKVYQWLTKYVFVHKDDV